MATAYLFCGLPGSGKTTLARELERRLHAVRFTLDHRMLTKHALPIFDERYGQLARAEKELIWSEALELLRGGRDVILDWSLWSRRARAEWTSKVVDSGNNYALFFLRVPPEVLNQRLTRRNNDATAQAHHIPLDELERFSHVFEPPQLDEGIRFEIIESNE